LNENNVDNLLLLTSHSSLLHRSFLQLRKHHNSLL
jgi:hypothetical protein